MYFATVDWLTVMPSFRSSPWIRGAPQKGIGVGHRADERADVDRYARPTRAASALPGPEQAKAPVMPGDHRLGLYEDECRPPFGPDARKPDPEQPVEDGQAHPRSPGAFQDPKLVPEREDLEMQRRARARQGAECEEDGRDDRHHQLNPYPTVKPQ
jgi:hypothetical protein